MTLAKVPSKTSMRFCASFAAYRKGADIVPPNGQAGVDCARGPHLDLRGGRRRCGPGGDRAVQIGKDEMSGSETTTLSIMKELAATPPIELLTWPVGPTAIPGPGGIVTDSAPHNPIKPRRAP